MALALRSKEPEQRMAADAAKVITSLRIAFPRFALENLPACNLRRNRHDEGSGAIAFVWPTLPHFWRY